MVRRMASGGWKRHRVLRWGRYIKKRKEYDGIERGTHRVLQSYHPLAVRPLEYHGNPGADVRIGLLE